MLLQSSCIMSTEIGYSNNEQSVSYSNTLFQDLECTAPAKGVRPLTFIANWERELEN